MSFSVWQHAQTFLKTVALLYLVSMNYNYRTYNLKILGLVTLISCILISGFVKYRELSKSGGSSNLEATYHALLTVTSLERTLPENHYFLPTVSLGAENDKFVPWGATIPTKTGDYIYTSFAPTGFVAPFLWFKFFDLDPSVKNLAIFNYLLGALTSIFLYLLLLNLFTYSGYTLKDSVLAALIGSSISVFSRETLLSHSLIYWVHSFYQPILALTLLVVFKYLTSSNRNKKIFYCILLFLTFLGPLIEWTAYIFNIGIFCVFFYLYKEKKILIHLFISTFIAGIITIAHYSLALGIIPTINAFINRFFSRGASKGNLVELLQGYSLSFGLFILVAIIFLVVNYFRRTEQKEPQIPFNKLTLTILAIATIPLLENLVMLQHASQFSFDRLKFIFPCAIFLGLCFLEQQKKSRALFCILILLSSVHGISSFKKDLKKHSSWSEADIKNQDLALKVKNEVKEDCALFSSNISVRGYSNLLFDRAIFENKTLNEAMELFQPGKEHCSSVHLVGHLEYTDLPKYTKAIVTHRDGSRVIIQ